MPGAGGRGGQKQVSASGSGRHIPKTGGVTLGLTSSPVGEILRYSLTSLLLSMALTLARLTFSYVNCRPSFKTEGGQSVQRGTRAADGGRARSRLYSHRLSRLHCEQKPTCLFR